LLLVINIRNCEAVKKSKIVFCAKERENQSGQAIYDYIHMSLLPRIMRYACIYCINKETIFEQPLIICVYINAADKCRPVCPSNYSTVINDRLQQQRGLSAQTESRLAGFYNCDSVLNLREFVPEANIEIDNHPFLPFFKAVLRVLTMKSLPTLLVGIAMVAGFWTAQGCIYWWFYIYILFFVFFFFEKEKKKTL
jgi:hypothetical protein